MRQPGPGKIQLSTDDLPERQRLETVREVYGRTIIKVDLEPLPDQPFRFQATLASLPDLGLACGTVSPCRGTRTRALVDSDDLLFNINLTGGRVLQQRGREAIVSAGEATLMTSDPGVATIQATSRFVSFRLPRKTLRSTVTELDACFLRPIPRQTEALAFLVSYANAVAEKDAPETPEMHGVVAAHISDLVSVALGATRDAQEVAEGRGLRAARMRAIKADIRANSRRHDLTLQIVAARHAISPRYVRMLFENEGTSFSEFVLTTRLVRAHRQLQDPRYVAQTISSIAFGCGFGDLSHFNRAFRRRFEATPSEVREAAQRK
jgi:AraC-like DNA-binding protein